MNQIHFFLVFFSAIPTSYMFSLYKDSSGQKVTDPIQCSDLSTHWPYTISKWKDNITSSVKWGRLWHLMDRNCNYSLYSQLNVWSYFWNCPHSCSANRLHGDVHHSDRVKLWWEVRGPTWLIYQCISRGSRVGTVTLTMYSNKVTNHLL